MSKQSIIINLRKLYNNIRKFKRTINTLKVNRILRNDIYETVLSLSQIWFEEIKPEISRFNISSETVNKYDILFTNMIKMSIKRTSKNKYVELIDLLLDNFYDELLIELIKAQNLIVGIDTIQNILDGVNEFEQDYLTEAIGCARNNFLRASIVLAWNASVHRMQRVVESVGFDTFNADSIIVSQRTDRRYRSFSQRYNISQISEMGRRVSDTHLLIMMEYWEYIDSNQCDRLFSCYTMRCNSAHPGEAGITLPNLASFYSDIKTMIFDNPEIRRILGYSI